MKPERLSTTESFVLFSGKFLLKRLFFGVFVFFTSAVGAQQAVDRGRVHLNKLAADEMYGRGYVRNGYEKAVEYVEQQFAAYGLQSFGNTYRQDFTYPVNTFPDSMTVEAGGKKLVPGKDFIVAPGSGSAVGVYKPVYFTLSHLYAQQFPALSAADVAIVQPYSKKTSKDSLSFIRKRLMDLNQVVPVIVLTHDKLTWSVAEEALPHAKLEVLAGSFDTTARTIHLDVHNVLNPAFVSHNVIGFVKAKKNKCKTYVVVTAHLDHLGMMGGRAIFNGANDNATGVSMLLTLAEQYAKTKPRHNMVFIAFGGEEAGLIGSKYYVDHPLFDLHSIRFLLNLDLMGSGTDGITVVNATKFPKSFEKFKTLNAKMHAVSSIKARGEAANSDHYWFTKAGVPSFFIYTMGEITAYHDIYDRPEKIPFTRFNELQLLITRFLDNVR